MIQPPKLVLVYNPRVTDADQRRAAMSGLERFRNFGVKIEGLDTDHQKVGLVRCGDTLKRLAELRSDAVLRFPDLRHLSAANVWHILLGRELSTGVAITTSSLVLEKAEGDLVDADGKVIGLGMIGMGAVVNVGAFGTIENIEVNDAAIRLAVIHEIGHVFGIEGHCKQKDCVMQENADKKDFIERFVIPGLDFCGYCSSVIRGQISRPSI